MFFFSCLHLINSMWQCYLHVQRIKLGISRLKMLYLGFNYSFNVIWGQESEFTYHNTSTYFTNLFSVGGLSSVSYFDLFKEISCDHLTCTIPPHFRDSPSPTVYIARKCDIFKNSFQDYFFLHWNIAKKYWFRQSVLSYMIVFVYIKYIYIYRRYSGVWRWIWI